MRLPEFRKTPQTLEEKLSFDYLKSKKQLSYHSSLITLTHPRNIDAPERQYYGERETDARESVNKDF